MDPEQMGSKPSERGGFEGRGHQGVRDLPYGEGVSVRQG